MKKLILIFSLMQFIFVLKAESSPNPIPLIEHVSIGFFYNSLSPYGEWIEIEPGFIIWRPFHISHRWRPYLIGRWIWTDYGWYWMSKEPFGWITYHYGRWYYDDFYGWIWIPDYTWGPAWVEWRYNEYYIGWAPLPPYAIFRFGIGITFTTNWVAPPHYWNFVRYHHFGYTFHYQDVVTVEHTRRLINTTRSTLNFEVQNDKIVNRGIDRNIIERRGNINIPRANVYESNENVGERIIRKNDQYRESRIEVYRPKREEVERNVENIRIGRGERPLSIDMTKIEKPLPRERAPQIEHNRREELQEKIYTPNREQIERKTEQTPRYREQKRIPEQQKLRQELLQRYEKNPTPPINRERQYNERKREPSSNNRTYPNLPPRRDNR